MSAGAASLFLSLAGAPPVLPEPTRADSNGTADAERSHGRPGRRLRPGRAREGPCGAPALGGGDPARRPRRWRRGGGLRRLEHGRASTTKGPGPPRRSASSASEGRAGPAVVLSGLVWRAGQPKGAPAEAALLDRLGHRSADSRWPSVRPEQLAAAIEAINGVPSAPRASRISPPVVTAGARRGPRRSAPHRAAGPAAQPGRGRRRLQPPGADGEPGAGSRGPGQRIRSPGLAGAAGGQRGAVPPAGQRGGGRRGRRGHGRLDDAGGARPRFALRRLEAPPLPGDGGTGETGSPCRGAPASTARRDPTRRAGSQRRLSDTPTRSGWLRLAPGRGAGPERPSRRPRVSRLPPATPEVALGTGEGRAAPQPDKPGHLPAPLAATALAAGLAIAGVDWFARRRTVGVVGGLRAAAGLGAAAARSGPQPPQPGHGRGGHRDGARPRVGAESGAAPVRRRRRGGGGVAHPACRRRPCGADRRAVRRRALPAPPTAAAAVPWRGRRPRRTGLRATATAAGDAGRATPGPERQEWQRFRRPAGATGPTATGPGGRTATSAGKRARSRHPRSGLPRRRAAGQEQHLLPALPALQRRQRWCHQQRCDAATRSPSPCGSRRCSTPA